MTFKPLTEEEFNTVMEVIEKLYKPDDKYLRNYLHDMVTINGAGVAAAAKKYNTPAEIMKESLWPYRGVIFSEIICYAFNTIGRENECEQL